MATIQFKRGDEYLLKLARLEAASKDQVCGRAIYGAAGIVADEIRSELDKVPTDERYGTQDEPAAGPKLLQKKALKSTLGISKLQNDGTGYLNVKIGWDGYNTLRSKRWPNGQPNQMVARSIARGTSFMRANNFVKRAAAASRKRAISYMAAAVDEEIEKKMKGT